MTLPNIFLVLTAIAEAGLGHTTQSIVKVEPVSPLRYEQQDGHLKILSSVVLSSGQGCTLTLDGMRAEHECSHIAITTWPIDDISMADTLPES